MKNIIWTLLLLFATSSALADEVYLVETQIYDNEELVGSPNLPVKPNSEAVVTEGEKSLVSG